VYAFGVLTWEIYVGRRAWEGLKATQVLKRVAASEKLVFPPQTPHRLKVGGWVGWCNDWAWLSTLVRWCG
jgi:hypothetical protein